MKALAVAVLLFTLPALADDLPRAVDVKAARLELQDGSPLAVDGGCWLRSDVCIGMAQEVVKLQAENDSLKAAPSFGIGIILVGLVVGLGVGFAAARAIR